MKNIDIGVTLSMVFKKSLKSGDRVTPVYSYNLGNVEKNMKMPDITYYF